MSIKQVHGLLMGEIAAGVYTNDDGCTYIAIGEVGESGDYEQRASLDEIEARALYEWLGSALAQSPEHD